KVLNLYDKVSDELLDRINYFEEEKEGAING
ncbi:ParA family protein, partial [Listeria monocytogenes]|nr:ParA family protein [Listeria monocytogenes]